MISGFFYWTIWGIRTFVGWYNLDSLLEGGLTWGLGGHGSPAEKPDVTTSTPPNKATIPATPYKAPKTYKPIVKCYEPQFCYTGTMVHQNGLFWRWSCHYRLRDCNLLTDKFRTDSN